MPVISRPDVFTADYFFIFYEKEILFKGNSLPSEADFEFFIKKDIASDWYIENNLSCAAMYLNEKSVVPDGCRFITIRQSFFERKDIAHLLSRASSLLNQRRTFRFCPTCGSPLSDDEYETAKKCSFCNVKFFPRIEPATITLVSKGDEILLVKNRNSAYRHFGCVSGFVEQGESLEQCAAREIKEETGIEVKNLRYCGSQGWPFPDQLMLAFTAEYKSGELKIQESEILEAGWFKRDSLPPESEMPKPGSVAWNLINGVFSA